MKVLYEDNHLIAINKDCGELVQGDHTGDPSLDEQVKSYLKKKYNKPGKVYLGVIHRLDRPVSGLVLFAKTSKALSRMNEQFKTKQIQKTYWAIVKDRPEKEEDTLEAYLKKNEKQNKSYVYAKEVKGSKKSSLTYRLLSRSDRYYLLEVDLHSGRHHQIRAQLAQMGCPIKGDLKYGFPRSNPNAGISLHAKELRFIHPVRKEEIKLQAPLPGEDLWAAFNV